MPDGGRLTIETANTFLDRCLFSCNREEVVAGQYVLLAITDKRHRNDQGGLWDRPLTPYFHD